MKKHLLILATLIVGAFSAKAQIISATQDNFEVWTANAYSAGSAPDPNSGIGNAGWWEFNILSNSTFLGGSPISVTEGTTTPSPAGGDYAIITTVALTTTSWGYVKAYGIPDTMGMLLTGVLSASPSPSIKTGVPYKLRLSQLNFYYKYAPNGVDTASCSIVVSHFSGGKRNILGAGVVQYTSTVSSWTMGTVNMFYDSATGNPDTIFVVFSSSGLGKASKPKVGSVFMVDGVSEVTGINELHAPATQINVYPNPASTEVNFAITGNDMAQHADIYDITGKKINTYSIMNNLAAISTVNYAPGLYFYQVYDKSGALMKTGKFSVSR
jgi:hypothetical protein